MEDLNWEASDASHFSAWLQPMLVTNPKARATAAQSAHHPFLELMDEEMVEEEEIQGTSSSSETARIHLGESAQKEGVLGGEIEDQGAGLLKLETFFAGEISRLEAKLGQVEEAKEAESKLLSKLVAEVSDMKAEKEAEKIVSDDLRRRVRNLEGKLEKLEAAKRLESELGVGDISMKNYRKPINRYF